MLRVKPIVRKILIAFAAVFAALLIVAGFGFYRVYYGKHVYESVAPQLPQDLKPPAILIFSKTNGFRQDDAIQAANKALTVIAKRRGWTVFVTENGAVFNPAQLSRFSATVWNNTSGDTLNDAQKAAFQAYMENGGGFVGIHGAGGDPYYAWRWYVETLIGAEFKGHPLNPQFQRASVNIETHDDPATRSLPDVWERTDEWYSFEHSPRVKGVEVLAALDENSYQPRMLWRNISMGNDHPVIWKHCVGKGRAFYSALGHAAGSYQEPLYLAVLEGGIAWAAGLEDDACAATETTK